MSWLIGVTWIISTIVLVGRNANVVGFNVVWETLICSGWPCQPLKQINLDFQGKIQLTHENATETLPEIWNVHKTIAERMWQT